MAVGRLFPDVPPEVMTPRARAYLGATAVYCFLIGLACLWVPYRLNTLSFGVVEHGMPYGFRGWGVVHVVIAGIALLGAWRGSERAALITLIGAAGVVGAWTYGFGHAFFTLPGQSPTGMIAYGFITIIHLIMARQPLRSPFDPLLRNLEHGD